MHLIQFLSSEGEAMALPGEAHSFGSCCVDACSLLFILGTYQMVELDHFGPCRATLQNLPGQSDLGMKY